MSPIAIFDSGYGGLTIFDRIRTALPQYDYLYLGDNARTPYGPRSYEVVYQFTRQAVMHLFREGSPLVILACNTASAKALRTIQQHDLPLFDPSRRVLGVIRPTVEVVDSLSRSKHVGVLATEGTINSRSYEMELQKIAPQIQVVGEACPMWVPLIENGEHESDGADYFVQQHLERLMAQDAAIDTVLLGCTHYPLLIPKIKRFLPEGITLFSQGARVAESLKEYLVRHPEMEKRLSKGGHHRFMTTEAEGKFARSASLFLQEAIEVEQVVL